MAAPSSPSPSLHRSFRTLPASPNSSVSLILVLYGIAIAAGNIAGGKIANRNPVKALIGLFLAAGNRAGGVFLHRRLAGTDPDHAGGARLPVLRQRPGPAALCGAACQGTSPGAVDVASALNIAAFNLGIAVGAWLGGLVVHSPLGLAATPWVGAILVAVALSCLTLVERRCSTGARGAGRSSAPCLTKSKRKTDVQRKRQWRKDSRNRLRHLPHAGCRCAPAWSLWFSGSAIATSIRPKPTAKKPRSAKPLLARASLARCLPDHQGLGRQLPAR